MNLGKETETLEFKRSIAELKAAMIAVSAILNKHGIGKLYFGVRPDGIIAGTDVTEKSLREVSRVFSECIRPQIYPVIQEEVMDGKHIIKVEFHGDEKPYSANGKYYLRTADENREVTPSELRSIFLQNDYRQGWEKSLSSLSVENIDEKAVETFCRNGISSGRLPDGNHSPLSVIDHFGLSSGSFLTNAGNLIFGSSSPITLKVASFKTGDKLVFKDMDMFEDNIINLLEKAEDYLVDHLDLGWDGKLEGFKREETLEIPVIAIREVLANSFAHARYDGTTNHL